jgi:NAD(P)-dependent dehydrogenase (short-subunit alcohol dehydrogenase family)
MRDHGGNFAAVLAANFIGPWEAIVAAREIMRSQPEGGSIVNVSTHYADHPYLFRTIYTVSKILLKALTKAARPELAAERISIADVAPTLIAGPRMEWVMRNYATKFSAGFDGFPPCRRPRGRRPRAALLSTAPFRGAGRHAGGVPRCPARRGFPGLRDSIASWYERIREWFRSTVPTSPPGNGEVAEAALFAAKDGRYLENPFLALTTLPPFSSFPPPQGAHRALAPSAPGVVMSSGNSPDLHRRLHGTLSGSGARLVSLSDAGAPPGQARISRPARSKGRSGSSPTDTVERALDLSDPRVVEPWLDNTLAGDSPPAFAILIPGCVVGGKDILDFGTGEKRQVVAHVAKSIALLGESARALRDGGHLVVVGPSVETGEGRLILAALRQGVRTLLAEQHFLPSAKTVRVSLLADAPAGREREPVREVTEILSGTSAPRVEPVPAGSVRP